MKTSDRELLELAAKAADYQVEWDDWHKQFRISAHHDSGRLFWEPLTDDGDALRLAVKLGIQVTPPSELYPHAFAMDALQQRHAVREDDVTDPSAATRRAIVRAAAEIEKQSK